MTGEPSRSHDDATVESFRRDPAFALDYLNDVFADGDEREVMLALRRIAQAFGGVSEVATKAALNPKTLYRTLSADGNPELKTLVPLLRALGMRLGVAPMGESFSAPSAAGPLIVHSDAINAARVVTLNANRGLRRPSTFSNSGGIGHPVVRDMVMA